MPADTADEILPGWQAARCETESYPAPPTPRHMATSWAQRLKRVFGIEIDACARCGGKLKIIASIEASEMIAKILAHLQRMAADHDPP